jgi:hypothetical protein
MKKLSKYLVFVVVLVGAIVASCSRQGADNEMNPFYAGQVVKDAMAAATDPCEEGTLDPGNMTGQGNCPNPRPNSECIIYGTVKINNVNAGSKKVTILHHICHGEDCSVSAENKDPYRNSVTLNGGKYSINSGCQCGCHITKVCVEYTDKDNIWRSPWVDYADLYRWGLEHNANIDTTKCPTNKKVCWDGRWVLKNVECPLKPCPPGTVRCPEGNCVQNRNDCTHN